MNYLQSTLNAADFRAVAESNFQTIDACLFTRLPSLVNGLPNTALGPPTAGTFNAYQIWIDVLGSLFFCTVAGTPGTWQQLEPALVSANPAGAPDQYRIIRTDLNMRYFKFDAGTETWIEFYPPVGGGTATFNQNVGFDCPGPVINGKYVGGRHRWTCQVKLQSVTVIAETAPDGDDLSLTLEVNGTLTELVLVIPNGLTSATCSLGDLAITAGQYVRFLCTGSPAAEQTAAGVSISLNFNASTL